MGAPMHLLFPGTFDPPTAGHLDLVERASRVAERVTVGIAEHPTKSALFDRHERVALFRECVTAMEIPGRVAVVALAGLVVTACDELGCDAILRGVRSGTDYDYEAQMANTNRVLLPRIETVLLATSPRFAHISSTLVRQVAQMGGEQMNLGDMVPGPVAEALRRRFAD